MRIAQLIADRPVDEIVSCETSLSVEDAARLLAGRKIGAMPVMQDGRIAGIFSERDVLYRLAADGSACLARPVGEVMTSPAITVSPDEKAEDALGLMTRRRIRHLPVCDGDRLVGFVSIGDLVKSRIARIESDAAAMRDYIRTV